ncbi:MAG: adenosylmethionine decarboxylase [Bacteroidia bacterium]|nr:adenosylmethionine decarboxylase [Bacteroidia bacterium]
MKPGGTHLLIEYYGCPQELLNTPEILEQALRDASDAAGTEVIGVSGHAFEPEGVTLIALLRESHISMHTWPAEGYAAADIFTCGAHTRPYAAHEVLRRALGAQRFQCREHRRG